MTTHFFYTEDTLVTHYKHLSTREIVSMFKNFCGCNAAVSDLYDGKSKNKKLLSYFFPNSHGCLMKIFKNHEGGPIGLFTKILI